MSQDDGRDETDQERLDRKWEDQLQELRVMQTGVQLLAGFLLTLPFQTAFGDLDSFQRGLFLALVVIAAVTTLSIVMVISVHRRLSGLHVKERVVAAGRAGLLAAIVGVALLVIGMATLIFDVVLNRATALSVGGAVALLAVVLLAVVPQALSRD